MTSKKTILYDTHVTMGAKMIDFAGFEMPVRYSSLIEEHMAVRQSVGVFDVSHMGEFIIEGEGALPLLQRISSNDVSRLIDGQAMYSCIPNDTGGIVDDFIIYRKAENNYFIVVNASNIAKDWDWINSHNIYEARLRDISDEVALFAVQGPKAAELLQPLTSVDLSSIKYYHFAIGNLAGIDDVVISGTGYTGSGGFELYLPNKDAVKLWEAIFNIPDGPKVLAAGLGARDTLRLEKGYCLYGNDIDDTTSPLEAGLGWVTKFNHDFVNADNLLKQKEEGVKRKLVAFKMVNKGIPRAGYPIVDMHGNNIGHVTSGTISPMLNIGIGLGYVATESSKLNQEIAIQIRNNTLPAIIVKPPFV